MKLSLLTTEEYNLSRSKTCRWLYTDASTVAAKIRLQSHKKITIYRNVIVYLPVLAIIAKYRKPAKKTKNYEESRRQSVWYGIENLLKLVLEIAHQYERYCKNWNPPVRFSIGLIQGEISETILKKSWSTETYLNRWNTPYFWWL